MRGESDSSGSMQWQWHSTANTDAVIQQETCLSVPAGSRAADPAESRSAYLRPMSVHTQREEAKTWFITFTCLEWLPLFELTNAYDLVYKWFEYMAAKQKAVVSSYVIMPNHLHVVVHLTEQPNGELPNISTLVGNGKRWLAYDIVKRLEDKGQHDILKTLSTAVGITDHTKGQKHRVFESSFDAKPIFNEAFMLQKLHYIHRNPVSGKWKLADDYTKYLHSSAAYYETGKAFHFNPTHWREVF